MSNWIKLHYSTMFIMFLSRVKEFIIPLFVSLFAGGTGAGSSITRWIFPALLFFLVFYSILYWISFRYTSDEEQLRIKHGIFIKKNRYITKERIQSVDITTGLIHRFFHVAKVKIETAGGGMEPEVELIAVSKHEANRLRTELKSRSKEAFQVVENQEERDDFSYKVPLQHIAIAGLTSGKVGLVFSAAAALLSQVDQFLPQDFYEETAGTLITYGTTVLIILFIGIAIGAWVISVVLTIFQYGRFTIRKREEELIIERGILEKRQLTLQLSRITSVRYVTNPIRQLFGMWTIYVDSAGGGSKDENLSTILLPLGRKEDTEYLMEHLLPYAVLPKRLERIPKRARRRYIFRSSVIWWLLLVPALLWVPYGWIYVIVPLGFSYVGWQRYRDTGFLFAENYSVLQLRHVNLSCNVLPRRYIQSLTVQQSSFQRKSNLYSLSAEILATTGGRSFLLKDIDERAQETAFYRYRNFSSPRSEVEG